MATSAGETGRLQVKTAEQDAYRVIGGRRAHESFVTKVRGDLAYAADWAMPGMLHGVIVRSQRSSARITRLDVSKARALPGVVAVLTAADVPHNSISEDASGLGVYNIDAPVLAADRVRYHGEPIAIVAAEEPGIAEQAAELIEVTYEDLPGVYSVEEALAEGAPKVHDSGNVLVTWKIARGDVAAGFAAADLVVEGVYKTQHVDHAYLETEAGVGWMDGDVVTLRVATQVIEHFRHVARILGIPQNKVRIIGTYMGGGFGGKEDMTLEPYLALLVWKTRRPVKMVWTRQESLLARPKRHPFTMKYKTGVTRDGRLVAQQIEILGDAGAYPLLSPRVLFAGAVTAAGPYEVPNVHIESKAVFTNNVPTSAFRGFGAMQVVFGYESQMDRVAEALNMSPEELRRRNFVRKGSTIPTGEQLDTYVALPEAMERAVAALGEPSKPRAPHKKVGRGFAVNMQPYGRTVWFRDHASCWMGFEDDGTLIIRAGVPDLGGGQAASLCEIAAEVLGVPLEQISVYIADTAVTPLTGGTYATRQLYMSGNAALKTARELRDKLAPVAAELLDTEPDNIVFEDGVVKRKAGPPGGIALGDLVKAAAQRGISPQHLSTFYAEQGEFDPRRGQGRTFPDYTYGAHAAEVEVDTETGEVKVLKYVACHDVGRAINVTRVEGQIQGGAAQGIGYALMEEVVLHRGTNLSTLFANYLVPSSLDLPDIQAIVLQSGEGKGPFGARGIGEPPIANSAATLANAVANAVGVRITELPITPERVLQALREAAARA